MEKEVSKMGQQLDTVTQNVEKIGVKVDEVIEKLGGVQTKLESISNDFSTVVSIVYLQSSLTNIEQETDFILDCVHTQAEMIRLAAKGQVSPKLLPIGTLKESLKNAAYRYSFKSLFTDKDLWSYYRVIRGFISDQGVATRHRFFKFNIYSFPSFFKNEVVMLKGNMQVLMVSKSHYSCVDEHKMNECVVVSNVTICSHPRFTVKPLFPPYDCCHELVMNATALEMCEFTKHQSSAAVLLLSRAIATFFPEVTRADISCQGDKKISKHLRGTTVFSDTCSLSTRSFYYPGAHVKREEIASLEYRSHRIESPTNLSSLLIPDDFKFDRIDKLVIKDKPWTHHITPHTKTILLLVVSAILAIIMVALFVMTGCKIHKRVRSCPKVTAIATRSTEPEADDEEGTSEVESVKQNIEELKKEVNKKKVSELKIVYTGTY